MGRGQETDDAQEEKERVDCALKTKRERLTVQRQALLIKEVIMSKKEEVKKALTPRQKTEKLITALKSLSRCYDSSYNLRDARDNLTKIGVSVVEIEKLIVARSARAECYLETIKMLREMFNIAAAD